MRGIILIVHRNQLILDVIREMLEDLGYSVIQARDGYRALGNALSIRFNLIIVNHALNGGLTGRQLVDRLKKYWVQVPIIGTVSNSTQNDATGFGEGTIDYILPAPFDCAELIKAVEMLTGVQPGEPEVDASAPTQNREAYKCIQANRQDLQDKEDIVERLTDTGQRPGRVASPADAGHFLDHASPMSLFDKGSPSNVRRILVVETDRQLCECIHRHLAGAGFEVSVFHNGREAYEDSMLNDYECILTDLWLPGMDGFEMIDAMRKSGVDAPIAILTAHITGDMEEELKAHCISKIIHKPVKSRDLLKMVQSRFA